MNGTEASSDTMSDSESSDEDCTTSNGQQHIKYQHETFFNRYLPYADRLDDEGHFKLGQIKANLGRSILLQNVKPGCSFWVNRLTMFLSLYDCKFTKEDHIALVKLLFELVAVPDLEFFVVEAVSTTLSSLLKKKYLITRKELVVEWKPLYQLYERIAYNKAEKWDIIHIPASVTTTVAHLLRLSRTYFPVESTQEMLDEWRVLFCPFSAKEITKAMDYLALFLPTELTPEEHDRGFKLWFNELMQIWQSSHTTPLWEHSLVTLFARLSQHTVGYIDWKPFIPMIFTRLMRSFHLPVHIKSVRVCTNKDHYNIAQAANFIVSMLGGDKTCQNHLSKLFKSMESFYHPSNIGSWNVRLNLFLSKLTDSFIRRLRFERRLYRYWDTPIPDEHKLSDDDVTVFVECLMPGVLLTMFSKTGCQEAAHALKNLAFLRPELIVPPVLERFYPATETLTEPHRLLAVMQCLGYVLVPMLQSKDRLPEGPANVLPILLSCLPGIDPNDTNKTLATFGLISCLVTLVPLIDCSQMTRDYDDLSDFELELCSATAQFEDFVLQFMDRCFVLVESASLDVSVNADRDARGMNVEEEGLQFLMSSVFNTILNQCSPEIHEAAVLKLCNYVKGRILGIKDSGYLLAKLVRASTYRANGELTLKQLLPTLCRVIDENCSEALGSSSHTSADRELLFNMLILQELVCCNGILLLPYRKLLLPTIKNVMALEDTEAHTIACQILKNVLTCLTTTYFLEQQSINPEEGIYRTSDGGGSKPQIPIRIWGAPVNKFEIKATWHTGDDEEIEFAQELVDTFLKAEMAKLNDLMNGKISLTREQLQQSICALNSILLGCLSRCPLWEESRMPLGEDLNDMELEAFLIHTKDAKFLTLDGENLRRKVALFTRQLTAYLSTTHEDNIAALRFVVKIYHHLIFYWGMHYSNFQKDWKCWNNLRKMIINDLIHRKWDIRSLVIHRVNFQHQIRVMKHGVNNFSELHQEMMRDLLVLSTSHYSKIRSLAQWVLNECVKGLAFSYLKILPEIGDLVENASTWDHEKLKGTLHILLGEAQGCSLMIRRDWKVIQTVWPIVVKTPISEKPSINLLLDSIVNKTSKQFETFSISSQVTESVTKAAIALWSIDTTNSPPTSALPALAEIEQGIALNKQKSDNNLSNYNELVKRLSSLLETKNLHWQNFHLGIELLALLIRHDVMFPVEGVRVLLRGLLHDLPTARQWAIYGLVRVLHQRKPVCPSADVDSSLVTGSKGELIFYDESRVPSTVQEWNRTYFVDKPHIGFYSTPSTIRIHVSPGEQPPRFMPRDQMDDVSGLIYDFVTSTPNVEQLLKFMSAEINKDREKLEVYKCDFFNRLFVNYGDAILPHFLPHLGRLISDTQDSKKRCGLEMLSGLVAGSKHWSFDMLTSLWSGLTPIFKSVWTNINVELQSDWCKGISYMMGENDMRRMNWLLEILMDDLLASKDGSFFEANRLLLLYTALSKQPWRIPKLLDRILAMIDPHLAHPYQNIRDELGWLLVLVFVTNVDFPPFSNGHSGPSQDQFVQRILPKLETFEKAMSAAANNQAHSNQSVDVLSDDDPQWKASVALLKTVCRWLFKRVAQSLQLASVDVLKFLPALCQGEACDRDPELQENCRLAIAIIGSAYLAPEMIEPAIKTAIGLSNSISWRARKTGLEYLQIIVFSNLFTVLQQPNSVEEITKLILKFLVDSRPEVRKMAALVLSGMFHCEIFETDKSLLRKFHNWANTPLQKGAASEAQNVDSIRMRHAGILGMVALVGAHPYDVADGMPEILITLGDHLNDPQPIQATVRQTLTNFWRTHHDNWSEHKLKFTETQLSQLTDLLVSPNYYA